MYIEHATIVRNAVDKEAEIREALASAKLDIKYGAALEMAEFQREAARKASAAALDALAKANRALSMCDKKVARLRSLRCGAAWGWPAGEWEELPPSPPLGVRVYRPKGGVSRVFARLLRG